MAYRTAQLAEFLEVRPDVIRRWKGRGRLKESKNSTSSQLFFEKEDIAKFLLNNTNKLQVFLNHKPRKVYADSYDILKKEVRRQYVEFWLS